MIRIDIDEVIRAKSEKLYKRLPEFVITLLKRIVHQKDINAVLEKFGDLRDVEFITAVLNEMKIKRSHEGLEKLDPSGRYIFAANHPLGGLDGFVLAESVHERMGDVRLVVNDMLMHLEPLEDLFVPVNVTGRQNAAYARKINKLYHSGKPVVYFPAGICSRKSRGKITDLPWKKNFVAKAIESGRDIVPVYVSGKNSDLFYSLANLRKFLGIKFNFEMILLPHELFIQKGTIKIIYGNPIPHETLKTRRTPSEWSAIIREQVYKLGKTEY